jgi:hypothetical protein
LSIATAVDLIVVIHIFVTIIRAVSSLFGYGQVATFGIFPVYDLPDLLNIVWAHILVIQVVSMLPYVHSLIKNSVLKIGVRPAGANIS